METPTTETAISPGQILTPERLNEFSLGNGLKPRPRPAPKPLPPEWERKWLNLEITHPDVQKLATAARSFAARWFCRSEGNNWCIVTGKVGTGKTHVSRKLCHWARLVAFDAWRMWWQPVTGGKLPPILFIDWLEFASPERCPTEHWNETINDAREASLIVIDDLGTETDQFKTGIPAQRLCELLNKVENKYLWATTNTPVSQWASKWDKRVEDRMLTSEIIEMNAPSYRSEV